MRSKPFILMLVLCLITRVLAADPYIYLYSNVSVKDPNTGYYQGLKGVLVTLRLEDRIIQTTTTASGMWLILQGTSANFSRPSQPRSMTQNLYIKDGSLRLRFGERDLSGRSIHSLSGPQIKAPIAAVQKFGARLHSASRPDTIEYSYLGRVFRRDTLWSLDQYLMGIEYDTTWNPSVIYGSLEDSRDGRIYRTVRIGNRTWMAQNLNYSYWGPDSVGRCKFSQSSNCDKFGRIYTWEEAMGLPASGTLSPGDSARILRGNCPPGWHVPSDLEWQYLERMAGVDSVVAAGYGNHGSAGLWLKSFVGWKWIGGNGTDNLGFRVLAGGSETYNASPYSPVGVGASFWTATETNSYSAKTRSFTDSDAGINMNDNFSKSYRLSLRCVDDADSSTPFLPPVFPPVFDTTKWGHFLDSRDSQVYRTVQVGSQTWMAQNLNFRVDSSWCYLNQDSNCTKNGRLYQWSAAMNLDPMLNTSFWGKNDAAPQGVCPSGWHVPSANDWRKLTDTILDPHSSGMSLMGEIGWPDVGMHLIAGGVRGPSADFGYSNSFVTSTEADTLGYIIVKKAPWGAVYSTGNHFKLVAHSLRCLKN